MISNDDLKYSKVKKDVKIIFKNKNIYYFMDKRLFLEIYIELIEKKMIFFLEINFT